MIYKRRIAELFIVIFSDLNLIMNTSIRLKILKAEKAKAETYKQFLITRLRCVIMSVLNNMRDTLNKASGNNVNIKKKISGGVFESFWLKPDNYYESIFKINNTSILDVSTCLQSYIRALSMQIALISSEEVNQIIEVPQIVPFIKMVLGNCLDMIGDSIFDSKCRIEHVNNLIKIIDGTICECALKIVPVELLSQITVKTTIDEYPLSDTKEPINERVEMIPLAKPEPKSKPMKEVEEPIQRKGKEDNTVGVKKKSKHNEKLKEVDEEKIEQEEEILSADDIEGKDNDSASDTNASYTKDFVLEDEESGGEDLEEKYSDVEDDEAEEYI